MQLVVIENPANIIITKSRKCCPSKKVRFFISGVPRGGAEGRFAPGGTLGGAAKRGKRKKEKRKKRKEREKGKKKEKENMGEACNNSETKMEHLSCGAHMHVKPNILAPRAIQARTRG